ncbi:hypothetical protein [Kribbella sp. NPDC051770]|uniref:hypothetical protein n=1 Tax=Kribbella sp. NPDC051770 TaxID=3155413 RepID=UPI003432299F
MNKQQRLRNTAEGFMGGLVASGFRGPWRWRHLDWELPFYRVWRDWLPQQQAEPGVFPQFKVGGHGSTSQAREMLWQLKRTSPFYSHATDPLPQTPIGLSPAEYLEIWVEGARPDEWIELATSFLNEIEKPN